jgi:hypothetical protein
MSISIVIAVIGLVGRRSLGAPVESIARLVLGIFESQATTLETRMLKPP